MQELLNRAHAGWALSCTIFICFYQGFAWAQFLPPRSDPYCPSLILSDLVWSWEAQVCPVGCLQTHQTPMLSVNRCVTWQTQRAQTEADINYMFFYIAHPQTLCIPRCKVTWAYLQSSWPVFQSDPILSNPPLLTHSSQKHFRPAYSLWPIFSTDFLLVWSFRHLQSDFSIGFGRCLKSSQNE